MTDEIDRLKDIAARVEAGPNLAADAFDAAMAAPLPEHDPDAWHGTLDDAALAEVERARFAAMVEEKAARHNGVAFTLYRDIDPAPRKIWMVEDMLGANELSVFYGAPGCGKSVLVGDAACHVAAGLDWHGRRTQRGAVLYVAAERGGLVKRRMAAWRKHHGLGDLPLAVATGFFDLCMADTDTEKLTRTCRTLADICGCPVVWIIVDTVAQVLAGGDENSGRDMGALVSHLAKLQQATGAHVSVIHHVPHAEQQRMRGHGALLGAADTAIRVEHDPDKPCRIAKVEKANDGPDDAAVAFTLGSVTLTTDPESGKDTTAPIVLPAEVANSGRTSRHVRMSDSVALAWRLLQDLAAEGGRSHPGLSGIPYNVHPILIEEWRTLCYRSHISGSEETDAQRMAFRRAMEKLKAQRFIGSLDEWVWIA
ncbi:AAA family ATPase [Phreatobacter sp. HK31-P]